MIPFTDPVQVPFEGRTPANAVQILARTWCATVVEAQQNQALRQIRPRQEHPTRITAAPPALVALL